MDQNSIEELRRIRHATVETGIRLRNAVVMRHEVEDGVAWKVHDDAWRKSRRFWAGMIVGIAGVVVGIAALLHW